MIGVLLLAAGTFVLLDSFARFALRRTGDAGTRLPTKQLVVKGFYRYVRDPMYVAVIAVILGQALLFGDTRVLAYTLIPWLAAHFFVLVYEEPTLRKTFGAEYETFSANVPRWIPRLTPWRGGTT